MSEAQEQNNQQSNSEGAGPTRSFHGLVLGAGEQIGPFRIERELGRGGAGVVYLAHDTKLDRSVAIKSLPVELLENSQARTRFAREARVLASLNHPNIAAIYDELQEAQGVGYLVLEYVPGQTLAERIGGAQLRLPEALAIARQIAEAVAAAHEHEVIHRDLKPGNIKITPEGTVKVLDFGLAKALGGEAADGQSTITEPGRVIGTPAYMSPEQARGLETDKRCDIWSFGCVLYEMLTGKVPFEGQTVSDTLACILEREPNWSALPAATPAHIQVLLRRCLQKDPRHRLRDIGDARIELDEPLALPAEAQRLSPRFWRRLSIAIGLATFGLGLLIGIVAMEYSKPGASRVAPPVVHSLVSLEAGHWLAGGRVATRTAMVISSDGRFLVYEAIKENPGAQDKPCLYLRMFDRLQATPIAGTEGGSSPFLKPDDRWVGFWAAGKLMKVPVEGGVPTALCDVPLPFGFSWGADDKIYFAHQYFAGLSRVSAGGGAIEPLTAPDQSKGEYAHRLPCCLPGGKAIVFTIAHHGWDARPSVAVLDLTTGKWQLLRDDAADGRYLTTGHLAFLRQGTLMVAPFDLDRLQITGQPVPAVVSIAQALNTGAAPYDTGAGQFSVSASGSLVYASGGILPDRQDQLVWVDRQGKAEPIASFKAPFFAPRLSPDGRRVAYVTFGMDRCVWVYGLDHDTKTKLTSEGTASYAVWSPDGQRVAFGWQQEGASNVYWQAVEGTSPMERLGTSDYMQFPGSWSPDGAMLAFVEGRPETNSDVLLLNVRDRKVTPFLNSRFNEQYPEISPDGRWMAYVSDESGSAEVYVQSFPAGGGKCPISNQGGNQPLWAPNGKQLFYRSAGEVKGQRVTQVWVVDVNTESGFSPSKPKLLFEQAGYGWGGPIRTWDISPDGERFLMVQLEERKPEPLTEMVLVQNWFEEVRRLAPPGKNQ